MKTQEVGPMFGYEKVRRVNIFQISVNTFHLPGASVEDPLQASWGSVGSVKATEQDGSMDNWWQRWKEIYATISQNQHDKEYSK